MVLAGYMDVYRVQTGQSIIREGDGGDFMLLIVEGLVDILKQGMRREQQHMTTVGPGMTLGEMSMIDGEPRFATCIAIDPTVFAVLHRDDMAKIILDHPSLGSKILVKLVSMLSARLRQTSARVRSTWKGYEPRANARLIGGFILGSGCGRWRASVLRVDDAGKTVTLPAAQASFHRASLVELAFAAGAGTRLVALRASAISPAVRNVPQVGDALRADLERIVVLNPDLILAWKSGNQPADVERLDRMGFPVFVSEPRRLSDIPRLVRAIGTLAGTRPEAERSAREIERGIQDCASAMRKRPRCGCSTDLAQAPDREGST